MNKNIKTTIENVFTGEIKVIFGRDSEEYGRIHGESIRGKKHTEEWNRKIGEGNKGKIISEEQRIKLSKAVRGYKHTDEAKEKMRRVKLGILLSEEHKMKIGLGGKGKHHSEETKKKIRESCKNIKPTYISSQEYEIQDQLIKQGVPFETHKYIKDLLPEKYKYHKWDIVIESLKVLIEVQGCYYHGCPIHYPNPTNKKILKYIERDKIIIPIARSKGWKVIEIWEHTIKDSNIVFDLESKVV